MKVFYDFVCQQFSSSRIPRAFVLVLILVPYEIEYRNHHFGRMIQQSRLLIYYHQRIQVWARWLISWSIILMTLLTQELDCTFTFWAYINSSITKYAVAVVFSIRGGWFPVPSDFVPKEWKPTRQFVSERFWTRWRIQTYFTFMLGYVNIGSWIVRNGNSSRISENWKLNRFLRMRNLVPNRLEQKFTQDSRFLRVWPEFLFLGTPEPIVIYPNI